MIVNLPKSSLGGFKNNILDFFYVVLFKSIPTMVLKNVISGVLNEAFCRIVESMDHIDLTAFSASDARKVIFLLQFLSSPRRRLAPTVSIDSYNKVLWTAWRSFVVVIMLNIFIC